MPAAPLTDEQIAFAEGGRLIHLAGCDGFLTPSLTPALACRVEDDRQTLTVLLARQHAVRLLADIQGNGRLSVLLSQAGRPAQLQLRGRDARPHSVGTAELAALEAQREAIAAELLPLGFSTSYSYALHRYPDEALVAIRLTISEWQRPALHDQVFYDDGRKALA